MIERWSHLVEVCNWGQHQLIISSQHTYTIVGLYLTLSVNLLGLKAMRMNLEYKLFINKTYSMIHRIIVVIGILGVELVMQPQSIHLKTLFFI